jgi:hypothetical protein
MFGVFVCVRSFCVCAVLYLGRGLATGRSLIQGNIPIVYRSLCIDPKKNEKPRHNKSKI